MAGLSVVVVNWNTRELLRDCLDSVLRNAQDILLEVLVVDNASTDGSRELVRSQFPEVRLIENEVNLGFAVANNQAFPLCSAEYVLLLNSDTIVVGNALKILVDFLSEHPKVGAVGPKVVHPASRLRTLSCGYQPTIRTMFDHYFFLSRLFPNWRIFRGFHLLIGVHDDRPRPVEWLSGACFLVRRKVIERVGPLSEDWFMYAEDLEWCDRISAAGWALYHVPEAVIEHYHGASAQRNEAVSTMWVQSLQRHFVARTQPARIHLLLFNAILAVGLMSRAIIYWLRGLTDRGDGDFWRAESRRFLAYARAAWK